MSAIAASTAGKALAVNVPRNIKEKKQSPQRSYAIDPRLISKETRASLPEYLKYGVLGNAKAVRRTAEFLDFDPETGTWRDMSQAAQDYRTTHLNLISSSAPQSSGPLNIMFPNVSVVSENSEEANEPTEEKTLKRANSFGEFNQSSSEDAEEDGGENAFNSLDIPRHWSEGDIHSAGVRSLFPKPGHFQNVRQFWAKHFGQIDNPNSVEQVARVDENNSPIWNLQNPINLNSGSEYNISTIRSTEVAEYPVAPNNSPEELEHTPNANATMWPLEPHGEVSVFDPEVNGNFDQPILPTTAHDILDTSAQDEPATENNLGMWSFEELGEITTFDPESATCNFDQEISEEERAPASMWPLEQPTELFEFDSNATPLQVEQSSDRAEQTKTVHTEASYQSLDSANTSDLFSSSNYTDLVTEDCSSPEDMAALDQNRIIGSSLRSGKVQEIVSEFESRLANSRSSDTYESAAMWWPLEQAGDIEEFILPENDWTLGVNGVNIEHGEAVESFQGLEAINVSDPDSPQIPKVMRMMLSGNNSVVDLESLSESEHEEILPKEEVLTTACTHNRTDFIDFDIETLQLSSCTPVFELLDSDSDTEVQQALITQTSASTRPIGIAEIMDHEILTVNVIDDSIDEGILNQYSIEEQVISFVDCNNIMGDVAVDNSMISQEMDSQAIAVRSTDIIPPLSLINPSSLVYGVSDEGSSLSEPNQGSSMFVFGISAATSPDFSAVSDVTLDGVRESLGNCEKNKGMKKNISVSSSSAVELKGAKSHGNTAIHGLFDLSSNDSSTESSSSSSDSESSNGSSGDSNSSSYVSVSSGSNSSSISSGSDPSSNSTSSGSSSSDPSLYLKSSKLTKPLVRRYPAPRKSESTQGHEPVTKLSMSISKVQSEDIDFVKIGSESSIDTSTLVITFSTIACVIMWVFIYKKLFMSSKP